MKFRIFIFFCLITISCNNKESLFIELHNLVLDNNQEVVSIFNDYKKSSLDSMMFYHSKLDGVVYSTYLNSSIGEEINSVFDAKGISKDKFIRSMLLLNIIYFQPAKNDSYCLEKAISRTKDYFKLEEMAGILNNYDCREGKISNAFRSFTHEIGDTVRLVLPLNDQNEAYHPVDCEVFNYSSASDSTIVIATILNKKLEELSYFNDMTATSVMPVFELNILSIDKKDVTFEEYIRGEKDKIVLELITYGRRF